MGVLRIVPQISPPNANLTPSNPKPNQTDRTQGRAIWAAHRGGAGFGVKRAGEGDRWGRGRFDWDGAGRVWGGVGGAVRGDRFPPSSAHSNARSRRAAVPPLSPALPTSTPPFPPKPRPPAIVPTLREQDARDFLGSFGLGGRLATQPLRTLSGGQRSRAALCFVLLLRPHVLCLDEPTNHLDLDATGGGCSSSFAGGCLVGWLRFRRGKAFAGGAASRLCAPCCRLQESTPRGWPNRSNGLLRTPSRPLQGKETRRTNQKPPTQATRTQALMHTARAPINHTPRPRPPPQRAWRAPSGITRAPSCWPATT